MSAVQRWNMFLLAIVFAVGILILGFGGSRVGVIEDRGLAFWPAFGLVGLEGPPGQEPLPELAVLAAVQVTIWTGIVYLVLLGWDNFRHGSSRRP